jgi:hypothetical protein
MKACLSAAALASLMALPAWAETFVERATEYRFQLDLHVSDAALRKMLPPGWEPLVATAGPARDANLRMIFIDRIDIVGADGKPQGKGSTRLVYLAAPVKQVSGSETGQMIIAGLTEDAADAPGAFGVYEHADVAKMARSANASGDAVTGEEDWDFSAPGGEHMQLHVKYRRGPGTKQMGETKFFDPADPAKYRIFKTEQGIDILRNATTNPPDRVMEFSYRAGGGRIAGLFDGSEKPLSWDSFPWYDRTVLTP